MFAVSQVRQPDELIQVAFDSLRERICVLDRGGSIVLTNHAWNQSVREGGANPARCGPGVNYLQVCRKATGPFAEHALEAAIGIECVLRGACPQFALYYPCPSPSRKAWFRLIVRPLRPPHAGAIVLNPEITNQLLLTEKLRGAEARYGALLDNPVDVATVLAGDGTVRYQSPASERVLGIRAEALAGRSIFEFVHPDDSPALQQVLRDSLRYPTRKHLCEYRFRNPDGSWRMLEGIARKLSSDRMAGVTLNSRDITHRKLAEQTLLAKQDALRRDRDEWEALTARLLRRQEEEHRHVAAELNGKLSQRLASVSLRAAHMAAPGQSGALQECVAGLGGDLHQLGRDLYPAMLDHFGLAVALRGYCAEFARKRGIPVNCVHRGISTRVPVQIAVVLHRVAEEALENAARHAHANQAWVTLSRTAGGIRLVVRDDGAGFDPTAVPPGSGLGLLAMRARLRAVNGSLSIRSRPGGGTDIVALAPLAVLPPAP
jgi:PAS domain S-box-containing protein